MFGNAMSTIHSNVAQIVTNKKFIIVAAVAALFIGLAFWVYYSYIAPRLEPSFVANKEFVSEDGAAAAGEDGAGKEAELYLFCTDWCPHCQAAKKAGGAWAATKAKFEGNKINGIPIYFREVNGEKEEGQLKAFEQKYKVEITGYPTIYLVKEGSVIEFETELTPTNLEQFLNVAA